MMLPKKVCQYIMAGIPESAIIEDNLTAEHKKLLPKKEDDAYCPDQVALLVITNKKWREVMKEGFGCPGPSCLIAQCRQTHSSESKNSLKSRPPALLIQM